MLPHLERFDKLYCETKRQDYLLRGVNIKDKIMYMQSINGLNGKEGVMKAYPFQEFDGEFLMKKLDGHKEVYNLIKDGEALFTYN